jgi:hypothetical protein
MQETARIHHKIYVQGNVGQQSWAAIIFFLASLDVNGGEFWPGECHPNRNVQNLEGKLNLTRIILKGEPVFVQSSP